MIPEVLLLKLDILTALPVQSRALIAAKDGVPHKDLHHIRMIRSWRSAATEIWRWLAYSFSRCLRILLSWLCGTM